MQSQFSFCMQFSCLKRQHDYILLQQLLLPVVVACHFRLFHVSALDLEHEHENLSAVAEIQLLNFKMQTAVKFHVLYVTYI